MRALQIPKLYFFFFVCIFPCPPPPPPHQHTWLFHRQRPSILSEWGELMGRGWTAWAQRLSVPPGRPGRQRRRRRRRKERSFSDFGYNISGLPQINPCAYQKERFVPISPASVFCSHSRKLKEYFVILLSFIADCHWGVLSIPGATYILWFTAMLAVRHFSWKPVFHSASAGISESAKKQMPAC